MTKSVRVDRPFVGIPSFLRSPICTDIDRLDAAIAVMGIPFDEGSPFLAGSRLGVRSLREHSLRFCSGEGGYYNPETRTQYLDYEIVNQLIIDAGDADVLPTNVEKTFDNITQMTRELIERSALVVVLGGDHSITYPVVKAFSEPLHVVHFDAIRITRRSFMICASPTGTPSDTSARCPMSRASPRWEFAAFAIHRA